MNYRIRFIVPYFGKFNNYFQLWLESCRYNPDIEWLIFTDDKTNFDYPINVTVHYTDFSQIVKKIQSNFDFNISLNYPYELCEFKLTFGEVFSEYLQDYDFWGHCDNDVIWGNLRKHLPDDVLKDHTKISWRGHLTLYKNDKRINALYRSSIDGIDFYKYALANDTGFQLFPEERAINYIFEQAGESIYKSLIFADLKIRSTNFFILHFPSSEEYKNNQQVFLWEQGSLFRLYTNKNTVYKEDFAYIHFLKRPMKVSENLTIGDSFLIVPNKFVKGTEPIDTVLVSGLSKKKIYWEYLFNRVKPKYFISKMLYLRSKYLFKRKYKFLPLKSIDIKLPAILNTAEW